MTDSVYSFRAGPTYRGATRQELFDSAMEQPLSLASTFFDQAKGGILESYGLGTAIRDFAIPDGAATPASEARTALRLMNPLTAGYETTRMAVQAFREDSPVLDEEKYKTSPWYRQNIPWDAGMTEARAKALAEWDDAKKVRQFYAEKRPITSFLGNLTGQAFDPINYVPVGGPLVRAAAVAKAGRVGGGIITGAVDAATNTALAGLATREARARFGDDVSFQAMVSEIATAALIGSAFGGVAGVLDARASAKAVADAQRSLATLKTTQEARIALNEAIDAVVRGEDVRLSPNATEAVEKVAPQRLVDIPHGPAEQTPSTVARSAPPDDLEQFIEAEVLRHQRGQVRDILGRIRDKTIALRDEFPPDLLTVLDDAIARNDAAGWADLRAAIDIADATDDVPDAVRQLLADFDVAFNTPALSTVDPGLPEYLRQEYATGTAYFREQPLAKLEEMHADGIANAGAYEPITFKALRDVIAEKSMAVLPATPRSAVAKPAASPEGRAQAEARIAKPDDYKALSEQYRVDPETGDFPELVEIEQMRASGKLTDEDLAELEAAQAVLDDANAYGEALQSVVRCLL